MNQGTDPGVIGHIGAYRHTSLVDAAVETLENVAFTSMAIARQVEAVLDGKAERHVVQGFRKRCLDLRNTAAREALDLADRIAQADATEQPRTA